MKRSVTSSERRAPRYTRMTQKGQVTIPQAIREFLGLRPQDRVRFHVVDGQVVVTPAPSAIERHFTAIPAPTPRPTGRDEREAFQDGLAAESNTAHGE